jgi:hypothetical protein
MQEGGFEEEREVVVGVLFFLTTDDVNFDGGRVFVFEGPGQGLCDFRQRVDDLSMPNVVMDLIQRNVSSECLL